MKMRDLNPFKSNALGKVPMWGEIPFPSLIVRANDLLTNTAITPVKFYDTRSVAATSLPYLVVLVLRDKILPDVLKKTYTDVDLMNAINRGSAETGYQDNALSYNGLAFRLAAWLVRSFPSVFVRKVAPGVSVNVNAKSVNDWLSTALQVPQGAMTPQQQMSTTQGIVNGTLSDYTKGAISLDQAQIQLIACAIRLFEIEASIIRQYETSGVIDQSMADRLTAYQQADAAWRGWANNFPPSASTEIRPTFPSANYSELSVSEQAVTNYNSRVKELYTSRDLAQAALAAWRQYFQGTSVESFMAGSNPSWPTGYNSTLDNAAIAAFRTKVNGLMIPFELLSQNFKTYSKASYPNATVANKIYDLLMAEGTELQEIQAFMSLGMDQRLTANTTNSGTTLRAIQAALQSWAQVRDQVAAYLNKTLEEQVTDPAIADQILNSAIKGHIIRLRELRQRLEQSEGAVTAMGNYIGKALRDQVSADVQWPAGYTAPAAVSTAIVAHKGNLDAMFKDLAEKTSNAAMYLSFLEKAALGYTSLEDILTKNSYPPDLQRLLQTISSNMKPRVQDAVQCIDKLAPVIAYLENEGGHLAPQQDADVLRAQAVLQRLYAKIKMWQDVDAAWQQWVGGGMNNFLDQKPTFPDGYSRADADNGISNFQKEVRGALKSLQDQIPSTTTPADCSAAIARAEQLVAFIQAAEAKQRDAVAAGYASYVSAGALKADLDNAWAVLNALYVKRDELQGQLPCPTCTPPADTTTTTTAAVTGSDDNKGAVFLGLAALAGVAYWYSKKKAR